MSEFVIVVERQFLTDEEIYMGTMCWDSEILQVFNTWEDAKTFCEYSSNDRVNLDWHIDGTGLKASITNKNGIVTVIYRLLYFVVG